MRLTKFIDGLCWVAAIAALLGVFYMAVFGGGGERSGRWPRVRAEHLEAHPTCAVCGGKKDLQVHHVIPFQLHPDKELDPDNLITLCRAHHLLFGHLGDYRSWNKDVREDAAVWKQKLERRPYLKPKDDDDDQEGRLEHPGPQRFHIFAGEPVEPALAAPAVSE